MRKYLVVSIIVALVGISAWAGENSFSNYPGSLSTYGYPGDTKTVYVDNTASTIQAMYEAAGGTWLGGIDGTVAPIGMFITCATTATHWAFGASTPSATLGHVLPADSSWHFINPFWMSTGQGYGAAATDNVTCQMTPEY